MFLTISQLCLLVGVLIIVLGFIYAMRYYKETGKCLGFKWFL
jgi:hypothetical protein